MPVGFLFVILIELYIFTLANFNLMRLIALVRGYTEDETLYIEDHTRFIHKIFYENIKLKPDVDFKLIPLLISSLSFSTLGFILLLATHAGFNREITGVEEEFQKPILFILYLYYSFSISIVFLIPKKLVKTL